MLMFHQRRARRMGGVTVDKKISVEQATMELMAVRPDMTAAEIAELIPVLVDQAMEIFE